MNPLIYDTLRVLRNRGVLLIIALTTALALVGLTIFWSFTPPTSPTQLATDEEVVILIMGIIFSFFVPLLGIQAGYSTYARDRSNGILESVLVRPVSRTQIIVSRYLAVVIASAVGIGGALLVLDVCSWWLLHAVLPGWPLLALFAALLVETVAFGGILFLIAHLVGTPGAVMGASVVIFLLVDVIWFFLLIFVGILLGAVQTLSGLQSIVHLEYADPAGYVFIMLAYAQGGLFGGFIAEPLSVLGIYPAALLAAGVAWVLVPFLAALYLARTRD